ncbi:MAG TPA: hypothetical protein VF493_22060, partial [Terriglobales bacterium]
MPQYLAPGVYVEEVSFRGSSIEGVGTSTAAFVGLTRTGPVGNPASPAQSPTPELLTSFGDFQRIYGGLDDLVLPSGNPNTNYVAHAAKAFFDNGGAMLYVSRVFAAGTGTGIANSPVITMAGVSTSATPSTPNVSFAGRWPGSEGNGIVQIDLIGAPAGPNIQNSLPPGSVLRFGAGTTASPFSIFVKQADGSFQASASSAEGGGGAAATMPTSGGTLLTLRVTTTSASGNYVAVFESLGLDSTHPQWIGN